MDYNSHIEAWLLSRVKVVGPMVNYEYQATIGDYDLDCTCGYGSNPEEARSELMAQLGY